MPLALHDESLRGLVALCGALVRGDEAAAAAVLRDPGLDWARLDALARTHRLAGWLSLSLGERGLASQLPSAVRAEWKAFYLRQWTKNERLAQELARVAERFEREGLEALFVKGPLAAQRLYGRSDARATSDLDLLLRRPEDTGRADALLASLGYVRRSSLPGSHRVARYFAHQYEYGRGDLVFELHWTLRRHPSLRLEPERVWRRRESVLLDGCPYPAACEEDELLAQIVSLPPDLQGGNLVLRPLLEVWLWLRRLVGRCDWSAFRSRRAEEGTLRMTRVAVGAALALFDPRAELAEVACALGADAGGPRLAQVAGALEGRRASPLSMRRRLGAFALYECAVARSAAWWALSLPVRMSIYRTEARRILGWSG